MSNPGGYGKGYPRFIRDIRTALGLSQTQFSKVVGVEISIGEKGPCATTVSSWERGMHQPRRQYMEIMCRVDNERRKRERKGFRAWKFMAILRFVNGKPFPARSVPIDSQIQTRKA